MSHWTTAAVGVIASVIAVGLLPGDEVIVQGAFAVSQLRGVSTGSPAPTAAEPPKTAHEPSPASAPGTDAEH